MGRASSQYGTPNIGISKFGISISNFGIFNKIFSQSLLQVRSQVQVRVPIQVKVRVRPKKIKFSKITSNIAANGFISDFDSVTGSDSGFDSVSAFNSVSAF